MSRFSLAGRDQSLAIIELDDGDDAQIKLHFEAGKTVSAYADEARTRGHIVT